MYWIKFRFGLARMHKAGGVLLERPPALRGLNPQLDVTDSPRILRFQGLLCPCDFARETLIEAHACDCRCWRNLLTAKQKIGHPVTAGRLPRKPDRSRNGAPGKDCPVSSYMHQT